MVDEKIAGEISRFKLPTHSQPQALQQLMEWGGDRLIEAVAGQFSFAATTQIMAVVQSGKTPVALVGIAGAVRPTYGKMVLLEIVTALENLAEIQNLRLEADTHRLISSRHDEALLVVTEGGEITTGTPTGFKALSFAQSEKHGSALKQSEQVVPAEIISAVTEGDSASFNGVNVTRQNLRGGELVENLMVFKFHPSTDETSPNLEEAVKRLTPTQAEVLRFLIRGLQYKEIADRMGSSVHTTHHHVSAILKRLNYPDKLSLVAQMRARGKTGSRRRKIQSVPPMCEAPVVKDLPHPNALQGRSTKSPRRL